MHGTDDTSAGSVSISCDICKATQLGHAQHHGQQVVWVHWLMVSPQLTFPVLAASMMVAFVGRPEQQHMALKVRSL